MKTANPSNVFIAAISSDIGRELALIYHERGHRVIGTHRSTDGLDPLERQSDISLIPCDISDPASVREAVKTYARFSAPWDVFISAVGQLSPIGRFFDCDIEEWAASVALNSTYQLRLLHALYPYRQQSGSLKVAFLVGGGVNGPFTNYSAYCLGKLMLIKVCELLDDEYPDVHAIAVGTGWVNTKIHRQTLDARGRAGANFRRTRDFIVSGQPGTAYTDIFNCIQWSFSQPRQVTGGRNFSVVHDDWVGEARQLSDRLKEDPNLFKLRRQGN